MFGVKIQMFDAVTRRLLFKQCECLRHDENYKVFNSQSQIGEVVSFWIACLTSEKWRLFQHGIVEWMDSWKSFHIFDPTSITLPNLPNYNLWYEYNFSTESFVYFFWSWPLKYQHTNSFKSWKVPPLQTKSVSSCLSFPIKNQFLLLLWQSVMKCCSVLCNVRFAFTVYKVQKVPWQQN